MKIFAVILRITCIVVFTALGLFSAFAAYDEYRKAVGTKAWTQIQATVISAEIHQVGRSNGATFCPQVKIDYPFQGQPQTVQFQISGSPCSLLLASVRKALKPFTPGARVAVLVNPNESDAARAAHYGLGAEFYIVIFLSLILLPDVIVIWRSPA